MSVEELLQMLQEKGMDDDAIKALLEECMNTLNKDFADHDKKEEEARAAEAGQLLGVEF